MRAHDTQKNLMLDDYQDMREFLKEGEKQTNGLGVLFSCRVLHPVDKFTRPQMDTVLGQMSVGEVRVGYFGNWAVELTRYDLLGTIPTSEG